MSISDELLDILVCPQDLGDLWFFEEEMILYNPRMKVKYYIKEGIPAMLPEEAVSVEEVEHLRYCESAKKDGADIEIDPYTEMTTEE